MDKLANQVSVSFAPPATSFVPYFEQLHQLLLSASVTDSNGRAVEIESACEQVINHIEKLRSTLNKVLIIGNGGSAAIASHVAIDLSKNVGIRAQVFTDPAQLTCLSNDYGYDQAFAKATEIYGIRGDVAIIISSSGKSANVINAAQMAKRIGCSVFTLAGFNPSAPLLVEGQLNFYIDSKEYGFVEVAHGALLHYITDMLCARRKG